MVNVIRTTWYLRLELDKKKIRQDLCLYLKLTDRAVHFSQRESESKRFLDPFISIRPYSYSVRKSADPVGGRIESAGDRIKSNQRLIERRKKKQHGGERVRLPGVKARERERERERESGSVMKRHKKEIRIQQKRENKMKRRGVRETNPAGSLAGSRCSPKSHVTRVLLVDLNERCNESVWRHREDPIIKTRVPFGNAEASHASHAKWLEWETDFRWRHYCFGTNGTACKYLA